MSPRRWSVGVLLGALLLAPAASAHQKSTSYSSWSIDAAGARVTARVSQLDLSRVGLAFLSDEPGDPVGAYLAAGLTLSAGGVPCPPERAPEPREAPEGWVVYSWRVACPGPGAQVIRSDLLLEAAPSHLHFARIALPDGRVTERVLSEAAPAWPLPAASGAAPAASGAAPAASGAAPAEDHSGTSLAGYIALGIEHIATGWDHIAFVVALLLLAGSLGEVATLVTSFTVAHSVTLALATLRVVEPAPGAVEALIGFSIALVAAENSWILAGRRRSVELCVVGGLLALTLLPAGAVSRVALLGLALFALCHFELLRRSSRPARLRVVLAFAFGLVHGFGFAGVLAGLDLPRARLVPALFGFNVGVELGQLAVVVLVWPLLRALARIAEGRAVRLVAESASAAVCGLGLYWFLLRSLG